MKKIGLSQTFRFSGSQVAEEELEEIWTELWKGLGWKHFFQIVERNQIVQNFKLARFINQVSWIK